LPKKEEKADLELPKSSKTISKSKKDEDSDLSDL